jgi:hypothetical protein
VVAASQGNKIRQSLPRPYGESPVVDESGPETESAIVDVDSVGAGGACTASMTSAGPSAPMV